MCGGGGAGGGGGGLTYSFQSEPDSQTHKAGAWVGPGAGATHSTWAVQQPAQSSHRPHTPCTHLRTSVSAVCLLLLLLLLCSGLAAGPSVDV